VTQWKNFEEKYGLTLSFTLQEAIDYYTKLYASRQSTIDHFVPNIQLHGVFTTGELWAHMKGLANHKASDIHRLKPDANDPCESITSLFNLVPKWRFMASRTININQMIFKSGEGHILWNSRTIILGKIFSKLYGLILEKMIN
jgi:hypothetical protein